MTTKKKDQAQSKRFIEKAREIEADDNEAAFERAFKKVVPPKRDKKSDAADHS